MAVIEGSTGSLGSGGFLSAKGVGHHDYGTTQHVFSHGVFRLLLDHHRYARAQHNDETWTMEYAIAVSRRLAPGFRFENP